MSFLLGLIAASALQALSAPLPSQGWVWTLYDNTGPTVVLAEEVPDTPHLRATLECLQGSGQARLTHYQPPSAASGNASLSSGTARLETAATIERQRMVLSLRVGTPLFQSLTNTGRLGVSLEDQTTEFRFDRQSLPRLRQFADLCAG